MHIFLSIVYLKKKKNVEIQKKNSSYLGER